MIRLTQRIGLLIPRFVSRYDSIQSLEDLCSGYVSFQLLGPGSSLTLGCAIHGCSWVSVPEKASTSTRTMGMSGMYPYLSSGGSEIDGQVQASTRSHHPRVFLPRATDVPGKAFWLTKNFSPPSMAVSAMLQDTCIYTDTAIVFATQIRSLAIHISLI